MVPAHIQRAGSKSFLEEDLSGELDKVKAPTFIIWAIEMRP
jgi:hypothetical protein